MLITGRQVKVGDTLYHQGLDAWGTILRFDPTGSAEFQIRNKNKSRVLMAQNGGKVHGKRQLYWHKPIQLDLPYSNISAIQKVVDAVAEIAPKSNAVEEGEA